MPLDREYFCLAGNGLVVLRALSLECSLASELLQSAGLTLEEIEKPNGRIAFSALLRLLRRARERSSDPYLLWRCGALSDMQTLGVWGFAGRSCGTLREMIRFFIATYYEMPGTPCMLRFSSAKKATLRRAAKERSLDSPEATEFFFSCMLAQMKNSLGRTPLWGDVFVRHEAYPRTDARELAKLLGVPVHFGARYDEIHFDEVTLDAPLITANSHLHKSLDSILRKEVREDAGAVDLTQRLRALLLSERHRFASAAEAARALGMDLRMLQRRLSDRRTTFSRIRDEARELLARQQLADDSTPISLIAEQLGFRSAGSFARFWKKRTRQSPRATRRG